MAKKKPAADTKPAANKQVAAKNANKQVAAKKSSPAKTALAKTAPLLNCEEVGHTAGQVWQALSDGGGLTAATLKKSVDAPGDLVMAAVGWLAREEKLDFDTSGRTVKIFLR